MFWNKKKQAPEATSTPQSLANQVRFECQADGVTDVLLVGDFTNWQDRPVRLKREKDNHWSTTLPLESGTYEYRYLIDGEWKNDPNAALEKPNVFGSLNSVRVVGSDH